MKITGNKIYGKKDNDNLYGKIDIKKEIDFMREPVVLIVFFVCIMCVFIINTVCSTLSAQVDPEITIHVCKPEAKK